MLQDMNLSRMNLLGIIIFSSMFFIISLSDDVQHAVNPGSTTTTGKDCCYCDYTDARVYRIMGEEKVIYYEKKKEKEEKKK